jgi:hypothetical protein
MKLSDLSENELLHKIDKYQKLLTSEPANPAYQEKLELYQQELDRRTPHGKTKKTPPAEENKLMLDSVGLKKAKDKMAGEKAYQSSYNNQRTKKSADDISDKINNTADERDKKSRSTTGIILVVLTVAIGYYWLQNHSSYQNGVYTNRKGAFVIKFPSSWKEIERTRGLDFAVGLSSVEFCALSIIPTEAPEAIRFKFNAITAMAIASNSEKKDLEEFNINGAVAYRVEGISALSQQPIKTVMVTAILPKKSIILQCMAPPKRFEEMANDFNDAILSIKSL